MQEGEPQEHGLGGWRSSPAPLYRCPCHELCTTIPMVFRFLRKNPRKSAPGLRLADFRLLIACPITNLKSKIYNDRSSHQPQAASPVWLRLGRVVSFLSSVVYSFFFLPSALQ